MKKNLSAYILSFLVIVIAFSSCDEDPTDALKDIIKDDLGYVPKISSFTLKAPASTTVPEGSQLSFDLRYWSEGTISDVQFWLIQGTDESMINEQDYSPAYSHVTRTDSLLFNYQIPAELTSGETFSIQARVTNEGLEQYPAKSALVNFKVQ